MKSAKLHAVLFIHALLAMFYHVEVYSGYANLSSVSSEGEDGDFQDSELNKGHLYQPTEREQSEEEFPDNETSMSLVVKSRPCPGWIKQLKEVEELGRGEFGSVHLMKDPHTQQLYAQKRMTKHSLSSASTSPNTSLESNPLLESYIMLKIKNTHIGRAFCVNVNVDKKGDKSYSVLMEYLPGGSLADYLDRYRVTISEILNWTRQVITALMELHKIGFIHGDIQPLNLVLRNPFELTIIDMGLAMENNTIGRSINSDYISPELFQVQAKSRTFDGGRDFWALGVTMAKVVTGKSRIYDPSVSELSGKPYGVLESALQPIKLSQNEITKVLIDDDGVFSKFNELLGCLTIFDSKERIEAVHQFMKQWTT